MLNEWIVPAAAIPLWAICGIGAVVGCLLIVGAVMLLRWLFVRVPFGITAPFCGFVIGTSIYQIIRLIGATDLRDIPFIPTGKYLLLYLAICAAAAVISLIWLICELGDERRDYKEEIKQKKLQAEKERNFAALVQKCEISPDLKKVIEWLKAPERGDYNTICFDYHAIGVSRAYHVYNVVGQQVPGMAFDANVGSRYDLNMTYLGDEKNILHGPNALRYAFATALKEKMSLYWEDDDEKQNAGRDNYDTAVNFFITLRK